MMLTGCSINGNENIEVSTDKDNITADFKSLELNEKYWVEEMELVEDIQLQLEQFGITEEMKEDVINHPEKYGEKQIIVAIEELSELQKELCKSLRNKKNVDNLKEEIADVLFCIKQVIVYYDLDINEIKKIQNEKVERTKKLYLEGKE